METPKNLTRADLRKLEEALDTADLEMMIACVDRIIALRMRAAVKRAMTDSETGIFAG